MRLPNFTRVQSASADNNVTLDNLVPGKRYTVELVAIIGTNTDCGSENITESEISNLAICTGQLLSSLNLSFNKAVINKIFSSAHHKCN